MKLLLCTLVMTPLFIGNAVLAADKENFAKRSSKNEQNARIVSKVEVQQGASLNEEEATEVSFAAGRILKHVAQARNAINDKKNDEAATHVDQGLKLVAIIDSVMPHHKVKTEIQAGNIAYNDEDEIVPNYVTVFEELERRDIVSPVVQAKREAQQKSGQAAQGLEQSAKGAHLPLAVTHADIDYTALKLDVALAKRALNAAKRSLADRKPEQADNALLALQSEGVLFEYEEIDLPLAEAADNLKLAQGEMKEGRFAEARAALNVAVDELKRYENQVGDSRSSEVKALNEEIATLSAELERAMPSEADQQKHVNTISDWWKRTTRMFRSKTN